MSTTQAPELRRRYLKQGELFAINEDVVQQDHGAFFWLFAPAAPKNERIGSVGVVRINGPLEYHEDGGGCDSYEAIVKRVECAMLGDEDDAGPPSHVALRIDSPGGVVAGLEQTVNRLIALSKDSGIPLLGYPDETAYSAAQALLCACSETAIPRSGFCGSIGVISTMVDQTAADQKMGLRFVVLTSGPAKADGHPHVPITDAMIAREQPRVMTLARQFFGMVKRARGLPIKTIEGFGARRFLGKEAVTAGIIDSVMPWTRFVETLNASARDTTRHVAKPKNSRQTESRTESQTEPQGTAPMPIQIDALIQDAEKAMKAEKDPTKLLALAANLEAYKKTKHMIEKHETEEGDEEDEDEDDAAAAGKGDETDRGDDEEDEDEDDTDGEDDAKKSKDERKTKRAALIAKYLDKGKIDPVQAAALGKQKLESVKSALGIKPRAAVVPGAQVLGASPDAALTAYVLQATGQRTTANALAALQGLIAGTASLKRDVDAMKKTNRKSDRDTKVETALAARRITPHEAKTLRTKKLEFVDQFLEMRPKGTAVVNADGSEMPVPEMKAGTLPPELNSIVLAATAAGVKEEDIMADMKKRTNGAGSTV